MPSKKKRPKEAPHSPSNQKRSQPGKRGLAAGNASKSAPISHSGRAIPFLTADGVRYVWPASKIDRFKVGSQWNEIDNLLSNKPASFARFENDSIFDEISAHRLPFVTDPDTIYAYSDQFDFGPSFYRDRREGSP